MDGDVEDLDDLEEDPHPVWTVIFMSHLALFVVFRFLEAMGYGPGCP